MPKEKIAAITTSTLIPISFVLTLGYIIFVAGSISQQISTNTLHISIIQEEMKSRDSELQKSLEGIKSRLSAIEARLDWMSKK